MYKTCNNINTFFFFNYYALLILEYLCNKELMFLEYAN